MAEDWAIWDVDVTTVDPGPVFNGVRVVVGGSANTWACPSTNRNCVSGIAKVGSFGGGTTV